MNKDGLYLCIDLAPAEGSVALYAVAGSLYERAIPGSLRHTEQVIPTIDALLAESGQRLELLSGIILNRGPGSFTGLRVAFSTAKALVHSRSLSLHSVCGSEARKLGAIKERGLNELVQVVTCLTQEKYLVGTDKVLSREEMDKALSQSPESYLVDPPTAKIFEAKALNAFGSQASHLALAFREGKSRRDYVTLKDVIEAAPEYYGTTRYASVGGDFFEPQKRS